MKRYAPELIALALAGLLAVALTTFCPAAEAPAVGYEHELVIVKLADGETAQVLRSDFTPVVSHADPDALVFTGPPGFHYCVVVSDGNGLKPFLFVEIRQRDNPPTPPTPVPPTPPDPDVPDPPDPVDPPNVYGVGLVAFNEAVKLADPAGVLIVADAFASGAGNLAGIQTSDLIGDINRATKVVYDAITQAMTDEQEERWKPWQRAISAAMGESWRAGDKTRDAQIGRMDEVEKALRVVK